MKFNIKKIEKALVYTKKDVHDDFWPDIFSFDDLLKINIFEKIDFNNYICGTPVVIDIPKPTLILRPGHYLDLQDRIYYQMIINEFAKKVDSKLLDETIIFGNRVKDNDGYFLKNGINAWKKFQEKTEFEFNEYPGGFLLKTDITAYFEHINVSKLIDTLNSLGANKDISVLLKNLLNKWTTSGIGIPQGYDASSFLGNVYLNEVDQAMIADGFNYYRFADDIRIFELEEKKIRQAMSKLTVLLRPLNLHLSGGKTQIIQKEEYYSSGMKFSDEIESVNYGIFSGWFIMAEKKLRILWNSAMKSKKLDKTVIKFCLTKFTQFKSIYPLKTILAKNLFDPSFARHVSAYLDLHINNKKVQNALVSAFRNTSYEYQRIFILKSLIKADEAKFDILQIDQEEIFKNGNFLLIGYYFILVYKFGNDGLRSLMKIRFDKSHRTDQKICRYFLIALNSCSNTRKEIKAFFRASAVIKVHLLLYKK